MPIPEDIRKAYKKRLESSFKAVDTLSDKEVKSTVKYLDDLGKNIRGEMSTATAFRADHLKKLKEDVDKHLDRYKEQLVQSLQGTQKKAFKAGANSTDSLIKVFGDIVDVKLPGLSDEQLQLARNFTEDLAVQLTDDARRKVSIAINEVALGVKKPIDAMNEIEKWVSPVKTPKGWVGSAYRAEMIVRTAVNRAFDMAARARAEQVEKDSPGLMKWWLTAGDERVRDTHYEAGLRYPEDKPIPMDQPFIVGNSRLMYPGDPAGLPEEVINCRCRAIYVHPKWAVDAERARKKAKESLLVQDVA